MMRGAVGDFRETTQAHQSDAAGELHKHTLPGMQPGLGEDAAAAVGGVVAGAAQVVQAAASGLGSTVHGILQEVRAQGRGWAVCTGRIHGLGASCCTCAIL